MHDLREKPRIQLLPLTEEWSHRSHRRPRGKHYARGREVVSLREGNGKGDINRKEEERHAQGWSKGGAKSKVRKAAKSEDLSEGFPREDWGGEVGPGTKWKNRKEEERKIVV